MTRAHIAVTALSWAICVLGALLVSLAEVTASEPLVPIQVRPAADGVSVVALCSPTEAVRIYRGPWPAWLLLPDFYGRCPDGWPLHRAYCVAPEKSREIQEDCR